MTTLTINWLQKCCCGNKTHTVESLRGNPYRLWDDDSVKCNACGREGIIQVTEGFARVLWETDEEQAERKSMTLTKDHNNHPANSPLTSRRLHQMRDILSKASAQRNGGDIGYAMSDAVKLIDEVLARRAAAFEATFPRENPEPLDGRVPIQDMETSQMRESLDARYKTMLEAAPQPSPVVNADLVSFDDLRDAVAEMTGSPAMQWGDIYKGHQAVPFINFNSLARIVDKFRAAPTSPVVPDEIGVNDPALDTHRKWMAEGWNRCRSAMLQGAEPVSEPCKLPATLIKAMQSAIDQLDRRAGKIDRGYPQHSHSVSGVWDQSNGRIANEPCSVCALWDEMRGYLMVTPLREVK